MKLTRKNLWIKWAFLPEIALRQDDEIPTNTNLCHIMHRSLLFTPLFCFVAIPVFCVFWGVIAPAWLLRELICDLKIVKAIKSDWKSGVLRTALKDFKDKTCTRIEIEK